MGSLKLLLAYYFTYKGRISRSEYWLKFQLPLMAISLLMLLSIGVLFFITHPTIFDDIRSYGKMDPAAVIALNDTLRWRIANGILQLLSLPITLVSFFSGLRRLHDRDKVEAWILLMFIPFFGQLWLFIELGFIRGTIGPNRYGPDPLAPLQPIAVPIEPPIQPEQEIQSEDEPF